MSLLYLLARYGIINQTTGQMLPVAAGEHARGVFACRQPSGFSLCPLARYGILCIETISVCCLIVSIALTPSVAATAGSVANQEGAILLWT